MMDSFTGCREMLQSVPVSLCAGMFRRALWLLQHVIFVFFLQFSQQSEWAFTGLAFNLTSYFHCNEWTRSNVNSRRVFFFLSLRERRQNILIWIKNGSLASLCPYLAFVFCAGLQ